MFVSDSRPTFRAPFRRAVGVILCLTALLSPGLAADPATLAPHDSALAIGWTRATGPNGEASDYVRELMSGLQRLIASEDANSAGEFGRVTSLLTTAVNGTGALALLRLPTQDAEPMPQLVAVIEDIEDPRAFVADLRDTFVDAGDWTADEARIGDNEVVALKSGAGPHLYVGVVGKRVVAGLGEPAFARGLATAQGKAASLATVEEFKADRSRVAAFRDVEETTFAWVDLAHGVEWLRAMTAHAPEAPQIARVIDELGLDDLRSLYWTHGAAQDRQSGVVHVHTSSSSDRGVLLLARQKPLDRELLKLVPQNAHWAYAGSLDIFSIWSEALRIAEIIEPAARGEISGMSSAARDVVGFSPVDDLIPILGKDWLVFDAPDHGGFLVTGIVLVATTSEGAKLNEMITKIADWLSPLLRPTRAVLKQVETSRDGRKIHSWIVAGLPIPVVPSWTVFGKRFAFALHPQTVATAMRQFDEKTRGPSLAEQPELVSVLDRWPKDVTGVAYFDTAGMMRFGYPFWNLIQNAIMSMQAFGAEQPVNLDLFPTLPDMIARARPAIGASWHDKDGVYVAYTGAGGPAFQMALTPAGTTALIASVMVPSFGRAREVARQTVAQTNARSIAMGCHIYADDHDGNFPPSLETLIDEGHLTLQMLSSPRSWGTDDVDYAYIAGQTTSADPRNILVYETVGAEGRAVAFVDGSTRFLKFGEFEQHIRDTYKRLNRMNELPPEFASPDDN
jgi:hypothetical protein